MKAPNLIVLIVILSVLGFSSCKTVSTLPLAFYEVEAKGAPPQMKLRMISDYSSVKAGQTFRIAIYFKLQDGYYTYTKAEGMDNLPTEIHFILPDGFDVVDEKWPEPKKKLGKTEKDTELVYDKDFKVVYTITAADEISDNIKISATGSWQVCKSSLCTLGGAELELVLGGGKKQRSELFSIFR